MKKILAMLLALMMVLSLAACGAKAPAEEPAPAPEADAPEAEAPAEEAGESYTIATVVKLTGVAWFDRMEVGVNRFAADHPEHDVFQTGAATADPAEQVRVIEDLIAQGVDAITVVPNSTESLEAVLGKAMEQGIVVVAHEASTIQNADCDVEAFVNAEYGDHFMGAIGEMMGGEGQYTTFVGALSSGFIHASIEVPPQDAFIIPMGMPSCLYILYAKKYATALASATPTGSCTYHCAGHSSFIVIEICILRLHERIGISGVASVI